MRGNELLDKMELVDFAYVEAADAIQKGRKKRWMKWVAAAACLCLIITGVFVKFAVNQPDNVRLWNAGYSAEDYFMFCDELTNETSIGTTTSNTSLVVPPYDEIRRFSDERELLEKENIIPVIDTHPLFDCIAHYNDDGSIYSIEISWHRRDMDGLENYSDLEIIAAYQEIETGHCIVTESESAVTVTKRDGIQIIAKGRENTEKTLTFQNDSGWYQISGSWNDDYEPVVELLDWFWEHPLDFERFSLEKGDNYTGSTHTDMPDVYGLQAGM